VEDGAPAAKSEYKKIEQDGVVLWVPGYMKFKKNRVEIVQAGFLWSAFLMVTSMDEEDSTACGSCGSCS